jgi:hypothetical protein
MSLSEITLARQQIDSATKTLQSVAKRAINDEVTKLLSDPAIRYVSFAQKASEYNDEGMYPGIQGPAINEPFDVADDEYSDGDDRWDSWVYDTDHRVDPRAKQLAAILNGIGEQILSDIFGDECAVDAYLDQFGNVKYASEYAGC